MGSQLTLEEHQTQDYKTRENQNRQFAGFVCTATGIVTGLVAYFQPHKMNMPAGVVFLACACFVLFGVSIVVGTKGYARLQWWLGFSGTVALISPGAWIAFGPGERVCSMQLPFFSGLASEYVCRGVFGLGTFIGVAFLGAMARRFMKT